MRAKAPRSLRRAAGSQDPPSAQIGRCVFDGEGVRVSVREALRILRSPEPRATDLSSASDVPYAARIGDPPRRPRREGIANENERDCRHERTNPWARKGPWFGVPLARLPVSPGRISNPCGGRCLCRRVRGPVALAQNGPAGLLEVLRDLRIGQSREEYPSFTASLAGFLVPPRSFRCAMGDCVHRLYARQRPSTLVDTSLVPRPCRRRARRRQTRLRRARRRGVRRWGERGQRALHAVADTRRWPSLTPL